MEQTLEKRLDELEREMIRAQRGCRFWRRAAGCLLLAGFALFPRAGISQVPSTLDQRVAALESKLTYVSRSGRNVYLTGANLVIRNGAGKTDSVNGYGNLVVGYGELRPLNADGSNPNLRTGSHNLAVGWAPNYSSFGGIVSGYENNLRGPWAGATAGYRNTVSGAFACSNGGLDNSLTAPHTTALGGYSNDLTGLYASASGGHNNTAKGVGSMVLGGEVNTANGETSFIGGGRYNLVAAYGSSSFGGVGNKANGRDSAVTGGEYNIAGAEGAAVSGGSYNQALGRYSCVSGGYGRVIARTYNWGAGTPPPERSRKAGSSPRSSRPSVLPYVTRPWAALRNVGGGAWHGCVYGVDAILERSRRRRALRLAAFAFCPELESQPKTNAWRNRPFARLNFGHPTGFFLIPATNRPIAL